MVVGGADAVSAEVVVDHDVVTDVVDVVVCVVVIADLEVLVDGRVAGHGHAAGGVMRSTGGAFELSGTIGQPDTGIMSSGEFELSGGFWFPLSLDDCNSDGWVDLIDYDDFDGCVSGPSGGVAAPGCNCFDLDGDHDIDLSDIAGFQIAFTGG